MQKGQFCDEARTWLRRAHLPSLTAQTYKKLTKGLNVHGRHSDAKWYHPETQDWQKPQNTADNEQNAQQQTVPG